VALAAALLFAVNAFLAYIGVYGGNIHTVVPNQMYRSAQLTGSTLAQEIQKDHIASVINLRGASPESATYQSEIQVCKQNSVSHDDIGMSAHRLPSPQDVTELLKDFQQMPKPILIHCKAGSDRTGLVATLYLALQPGQNLDAAEHEQLTWHYGHFGMFGTQAMDDFFDLYRKTSNGESLRDWLQKTYPAQYRKLQLDHSWEVSTGPGGE
jgi:protein tyrosine phosphatase (PTP) superfamily phosphohydrolase (DUF442 family)